jgi:hypothetical protein
LASCAVLATPASAGVTEFFDPNMFQSHYDIETYANAGFTTSITNRVGVQGFGTALQTSYEVVGPSSPAARFNIINPLFVYDPSISGEITSIDASFDQLMFMFHDSTRVNLSSAPALLRLIAEQDGQIYRSNRTAFTGLPFDQWINVSATGLVESEFLLFNPANPFAALTTPGLDFAGGSITFGLQIAHFGVLLGNLPSTGRVRSTIGVDNLRITLNTLDPVGAIPEPTTWVLMIGGFGLAGAVLRGRRRVAA